MRVTILAAGTVAASILAAALPAGCQGDVRAPADAPTYASDVAVILDARCVRCHAGDAPAGGFRANTYGGAIGCTAKGSPAVLPRDAAPLLLALDRPDHRDFATDEERATLGRWVEAGAQGTRGGVHPPSFADPRSSTSHAAALRSTRYRALTDPNDSDRCAQCHEGAGARPARPTTAPGATACTSCHTEANGVNACSTCHGAPNRPYPPRDPCFYATDTIRDAHIAHEAPSASRATGLACDTCHPGPAVGAFDGAHGDGYIEVWFGAAAGRLAKFDAVSRSCTGTCHARGGTNPEPAWRSDGVAADCNSCHTSPPANHFPGACTNCHREANANGTALDHPVLHVNGKVDLGDGSGGCGACHGTGFDPWPKTGAHAAHKSPANAAPVACETCHVVPRPGEDHPSRTGTLTVRLAGLATSGGAPATYDPATKTCASTYCHANVGAARPSPRWNDGPSATTCGSCHSTPPPPPHAQDASCGASSCHAGITNGLTITAAGRVLHVDGLVERTVP